MTVSRGSNGCLLWRCGRRLNLIFFQDFLIISLINLSFRVSYISQRTHFLLFLGLQQERRHKGQMSPVVAADRNFGPHCRFGSGRAIKGHYCNVLKPIPVGLCGHWAIAPPNAALTVVLIFSNVNL